VHAPTEDKSDDKKEGLFYEELERVVYQFPKYHMKILLGDLKVGKEDMLKTTMAKIILHEIVYDKGVRVLNFGISENLSRINE
jgi:hypothetical protein